LSLSNQKLSAHGLWALDERHGVRSSTWRELEGLFRLFSSFVEHLRSFTMVARGDALNVFWLLYRGGSRAEHLQEVCLRIFWFCHENSIELQPEWIPRDQNQLANYLSKIREFDDFGLQPSVFQSILRDFAPLQIDRFASEHNALLPVFNSEFWCPSSEGGQRLHFLVDGVP
jgi:hypothetical protein